MGFIGKALGDTVGDLTGASEQASAGKRAGKIQAKAAQAAIDEQRRQFDKFIELMSPYVAAGTPALEQQQALIGLKGPEAEQAAIEEIASSPQLAALARQGEEAMLQQASATGGLRGGNIQAALAQFRPQMLQRLIDQRYGQLGGMTDLGFGAAGMQGQQRMNLAANIANLLTNKGAAQAGGIIAQGSGRRAAFSDALEVAGLVASLFSVGGGLKTPTSSGTSTAGAFSAGFNPSSAQNAFSNVPLGGF